MKYQEILRIFRNRPLFESRELDVFFDEAPEQIRARLSRWVAQGKLVQIRRGVYLLPEEFQTVRINPFNVANIIYRPSYISLHTALEFYGHLPEKVFENESITIHQTRKWHIPLGVFSYRSLDQKRFWGYYLHSSINNNKPSETAFFIAYPEKALLDLFYLSPGKWTVDCLQEMRFQNLDSLDRDRLSQFTERFNSPKVTNAVRILISQKEEWI